MAWLRRNWPGLALGAVVLLAALAASSRVVGLAWDDGVYVAAGRSLARGAGYLLADRVGDQAVPLYPAGYPLVVALTWLVAGSPAAALAALAAFSALCVSAAALLWWRLLRDEVAGACTTTLLVAVPALSYATLLTGELRMADAPYALLVAAAASLWRRALESRRAMAALIVIAALAVSLRTAGAVLPIAVALLLVAQRRRTPALATVALAVAVHLALHFALRPPEPSYLEVIRVAWAHGGSGLAVLGATLGRDLWTSAAALVAPPLVYSSAVQRLVQSGASRVAYALAVGLVCLAVAAGGWRRLRADRWQVGDLVLVGVVALIFVMPVGMLPRFLVPVGPVLALWAWEGTGARGRRWSVGAVAALIVVVALTADEAVRHVRSQPRVLAERAVAYAAAGRAAGAWLGTAGFMAAEFPEALWFETGRRAVSTTTPLENVQTEQAGFESARRRLEPLRRGCLLDTRSFPVSRELFAEYMLRPDAVVLPGLDARWVRAVCWGSGAGAPGR